jgi:membrane protein DedA with SNARE-associated domain
MVEGSSLIGHFPYAGLLLLLFLGEIGLPFPEDATLILAGFLIAQGITVLVPTLSVVYLGLLITDFSLYLVGKRYGRKLFEYKRLRKILSPDRLSWLEQKFEKWGVWVVLVGRHVVGIRAQIFLSAGISKMSSIKFILADALSAIFTVLIMVGIGYFGGHSIEALKKDVTRVEHYMILTSIFLLCSWLIFKSFRNKTTKPPQEEREKKG